MAGQAFKSTSAKFQSVELYHAFGNKHWALINYYRILCWKERSLKTMELEGSQEKKKIP